MVARGIGGPDFEVKEAHASPHLAWGFDWLDDWRIYSRSMGGGLVLLLIRVA